MAAKTTTRGRAKAKPAEAKPENNGAATYAAPDPPLREQAAAERKAHGYDGRLTPEILLELEPLLAYPLDPRYIEHTPPTQGKPYPSTGVRSVQVQMDRLNDVLGSAHWRVLYSYASNGQLCRVVLIVGNDLANATLDEAGELIPYRHVPAPTGGSGNGQMIDAEVLAVREGWGGHSRGRTPGDFYKGSETNALKRVIARMGPGREVYALDVDDDVNLSNEPEASAGTVAAKPAQAKPPQRRGKAAQPEAVSEADLIKALDAILDEPGELRELRIEANKGMAALGAPTTQRLSELRSAQDEKQLTGLIERVNTALDAGSGPPPPDDEPDQDAVKAEAEAEQQTLGEEPGDG